MIRPGEIQHKGHLSSAFKEEVQAKMNSFKGRWQGSLSGQIRGLPDFELVVRELNKHLRKI